MGWRSRQQAGLGTRLNTSRSAMYVSIISDKTFTRFHFQLKFMRTLISSSLLCNLWETSLIRGSFPLAMLFIPASKAFCSSSRSLWLNCAFCFCSLRSAMSARSSMGPGILVLLHHVYVYAQHSTCSAVAMDTG